jgi:hypothetical protein
VQEAVEKTGEAVQRLEQANKRTESIFEPLKGAIALSTNEEQRKKLEEVQAVLSKSYEATSTAEQKLNTSLDVQTAILKNVEPQDVQATGIWGIVVSADKELRDTQNKVRDVQALGYQNVKIYNRQNWLRTVVEFSDFAEAQAALPKLRSFRSSSYLVNINKWCPSRSESNGMWQCPGQ